MCAYTQDSNDLSWQLVGGDVSSRTPPRDHTSGTGRFAFVDGSTEVSVGPSTSVL